MTPEGTSFELNYVINIVTKVEFAKSGMSEEEELDAKNMVVATRSTSAGPACSEVSENPCIMLRLERS